MRRTRTLTASLLAGTLLATAMSTAASANPETQSITGTIANTIAVDLSTPTVTQALVVGANTIDGGTLTVSGNVATTTSVAFDKTAMTEWDGTGYVAGGDVLGTALSLTALSNGVSAGTATSATGGELLSTSVLGESVFNLSYSQPVLLTDPAGQYHIKVTYTAAATV